MQKGLHACWLTCALLLLTLPAFGQKPATILEGSWEMISQRLIYPDTTITRNVNEATQYKFLNSTHFSWGRQVYVDGEAQEEVFGGGGRYSIVGDSIYIEHIEFHSNPTLMGVSVEFNARVAGDLWYHTGVIGDFMLEEVWRRLE